MYKVGDRVVPRDRDDMWRQAHAMYARSEVVRRMILERPYLEVTGSFKDDGGAIQVKFQSSDRLGWHVRKDEVSLYNSELEGTEL